jgi:short subunit dehydrogenase-like uncharacterized protein
MSADFLLYGATGFVGMEMARTAVQNDLKPLLAGRNEDTLQTLAQQLNLQYRAFELEDDRAIDAALDEVDVVLHCAGPYLYTYKPMIEACLRNGVHYLDITGELPVYKSIFEKGAQAKENDVMLLPGVGFDVVPTDCLAAHLKRRLPSATKLTIAYYSQGPAGFPPGTISTLIEMVPYNTNLRRKDGIIQPGPRKRLTRMVDFGQGPVEAILVTWGDIFMAYLSTGIPNIEDYAVISDDLVQQLKLTDSLKPLFKFAWMRRLAKSGLKGGSSAAQRAQTEMHIWAEVVDPRGEMAISRLHGPEGGVDWTVQTALAAVQKVKAGAAKPGFQTPAKAFGPDFVLQGEGVVREDLS